MDFLIHLAIIGAGLFALGCLVVSPKATLFVVSVLVCGYVGSGEGFLGTCMGLAAGAAVGGVLAGIVAALQAAYRALTADPRPASLPATRPDTQDRAET